MNILGYIRAIPHEAVVNVLDLVAFVLITPELLGERRLDLLTSWIRRILGGWHRNWAIVAALFVAGRVVGYFGVPRGWIHLLVLLGIAALIGGSFALINRFVRTTPSRQLMLVLGAALFVCARVIGIFAALE